MPDVNLEAVKEITKTIRELYPDKIWLKSITVTLVILTILVLYLCVATFHKQPTAENNSFCSTKKDTVYVMPMQLKIYQDSIQTKEGCSK
ncbi:MAG: hypothetical protein LBC75_09610 [Fibromonadaceae bacterium]|jgi:hypothetical protein|nr:hypothetical protein [Fibromonadaceae bacterium]